MATEKFEIVFLSGYFQPKIPRQDVESLFSPLARPYCTVLSSLRSSQK